MSRQLLLAMNEVVKAFAERELAERRLDGAIARAQEAGSTKADIDKARDLIRSAARRP